MSSNNPAPGEDLTDAYLDNLGFLGESIRTSASGTFTTTETVVQSLTFNAVAGQRYKVTVDQLYQSTVAGDVVQIQIKWAAGASVTSSGTRVRAILPTADTASKSAVASFCGTFTPGAGQMTVGVTMVRNAGTGNVSSFGAVGAEDYICVEGV